MKGERESVSSMGASAEKCLEILSLQDRRKEGVGEEKVGVTPSSAYHGEEEREGKGGNTPFVHLIAAQKRGRTSSTRRVPKGKKEGKRKNPVMH